MSGVVSGLVKQFIHDGIEDLHSIKSMIIPAPPGTTQIPDKRILDGMKQTLQNTPGYSFRNANMTLPGAALQLLNVSVDIKKRKFHNPNNIISRGVRLLKEEAYVVHSDNLDKLSTVCAIFVFLATMMLFYSSNKIKASRVYVFDNPDDAKDIEKQKQLDELNSGWMANLVLPLAYVTTGITAWRIFKRTTTPLGGERIKDPYGLKSIGRTATSIFASPKVAAQTNTSKINVSSRNLPIVP